MIASPDPSLKQPNTKISAFLLATLSLLFFSSVASAATPQKPDIVYFLADNLGWGDRFNAICPKRVETPFIQSRIKEFSYPEKAYREMASTQLNGHMAWPDEITTCALYLGADESAMLSRSNLMIDGGAECRQVTGSVSY